MKKLIVAVLTLAGLFVAGFYVLNTAKYKPAEDSVEQEVPQQSSSGSPLFIGGYVINRGTGSIGSMQANLNGLDAVVGDWAHYDGNRFAIDDSQKQSQIIQAAKKAEKNVQIVGMVNNYQGGWKGTEVAAALTDQQKKNDLIESVVNFAKSNNFTAVAMDFESLPNESEQGYLLFLQELRQKLNADGKLLWVHLYFDNHYYKRYAEYTDKIIVMAYDQHNSLTGPGPISGKTWLLDNLKKVLAVTEAKKVAVGFGSYAYDWQQGSRAKSISYSAAVQLAKEHGQKILFDPEQSNSYFEYVSDGQSHQVWLVDNNTVAELTKSVLNEGIRSVFIYRFGSEDQRIWQTLKEIKGQ